jgi:hypothetical protein
MDDKTRLIDRETWNDIAPEFQRRWQGEFPNGVWDDYEPWYRYGYEMAHDPLYSSRTWVDVEADLKEKYPEWAEHHGYRYDKRENLWERFKANVQEAWNTIAGR